VAAPLAGSYDEALYQRLRDQVAVGRFTQL
jgi:hypothetical protein